jgi:hypothetical protein
MTITIHEHGEPAAAALVEAIAAAVRLAEQREKEEAA